MPQHKYIKRIMREMAIMQKDKEELNAEGIYIDWNDDNVLKIRAMIICLDKESPYYGGFYLFLITIPPQYPLDPPKVKFCTTDGKSRLHPNLYWREGKVCLSIINTWAGPGWGSCITIRAILLTIQSIMTPNPLVNEPGYESAYTDRHKKYEEVVRHQVLKVAVLQQLKKVPPQFKCFQKVIRSFFRKNYLEYQKIINKNKHKDGAKIDTNYSMSIVLEYGKIGKKFNENNKL